MLDPAGEIDRKAIGAIVFADRDELAWLESVLHPRTQEAQRRWIETVEAPLAVIEVPLLYETGAEERFDAVVVITARPAVRTARKELTALDERLQRMLPDEEKVRRADYAYVNDGTVEELERFVAQVADELEARR